MYALTLKVLGKIARIIIGLFTIRKRNRIILVCESASGSNSYALLKQASDEIKKKYEIIFIYEYQPTSVCEFIKKHRLLSTAQLIITTHGTYKPSKNHLHLQLWHGALIKKNGVMLYGDTKEMYTARNSWRQSDYIMSYSETYTTFVNACMVTNPNKYIITGAPRNDLLLKSDGKSNLKKIFNNNTVGNKIIFFLPTFRDDYSNNHEVKKLDSLFGFENFSLENFDNFLGTNKCQMIYKPHPHQEHLALNYFSDYGIKNIIILKNDDLAENSLDLYELLNACDMLITDYSSVFYDYLLLNRPIIFAPTEIEQYKKMRGFLVESFENWTPGPNVYNQNTLQKEISQCIAGNDYYRDKRNMIKNLMHRFKDDESSKRLWSFIDNKIFTDM